MKFRNFLVRKTQQQAYFKDGIENLYPSINGSLKIAILPAYGSDGDAEKAQVSWIPAVLGDDEADFYTTIRAAKFVGHGNRRAKTSFLSPKTFDLDADDPYEAFFDYCSRSDKWGYLTKDNRGKRLTGEVEGAVFPRMRNYFAANVMDVAAGTRGGVFVAEFSESVAKGILYSEDRNGKRLNGLAFERDEKGRLMFGDITSPDGALVIEIAFNGKTYSARPALDAKGCVMRVKIPDTLLRHRVHMEDPESFLVHPGTGQDIVDRLAGMLRGYKSPDGDDEIDALKEAMAFSYGSKYIVDDDAVEIDPPSAKAVMDDPFGDAAEKTASGDDGQKADEVSASVERGVERERYVPVGNPDNPETPENPGNTGKPGKPDPKPRKGNAKARKADREEKKDEMPHVPGEDIDPADIASIREMLKGGR